MQHIVMYIIYNRSYMHVYFIYMYHNYIYSSIRRHLHHFCIMPLNIDAMNRAEQLFLQGSAIYTDFWIVCWAYL